VRLTINGEQVSYSLEQERTLGEVARGVRGWLAGAGFLVTAMKADTRDILVAPAQEWGSIEVWTVHDLDVTATHTGDMKIDHWSTVHTWLGMLRDELRQVTGPAAGFAPASPPEAPGALGDLLLNVPQTLEGFVANPFLPRGSEAARRFEALFTGQDESAVRAWPAERVQRATAAIDELRAALERRVEDATHSRDALTRCTGRLSTMLAGLTEVSVLLQTGRDKAAMDIVIEYTDSVQELIDLLPFLPPDAERGRLLVELMPVLRELVGAFDARDTVLIGDLLEYEIAPRMKAIMPLLEKAP